MNRIVVAHDGLRHAVLDWGGDAVPLVLLHPNGFCAGAFSPLAEQLAATGRYRPVGIDLRGHGATDRPPAQDDYRYAPMARDVVAVLDHLGIDEAVLLATPWAAASPCWSTPSLPAGSGTSCCARRSAPAPSTIGPGGPKAWRP